MPVSVVTKRDLLLSFCESKINAHKTALGITATLKTANRYRHQTDPRTSRLKRIEVMGEETFHAFYLEVLHIGPHERTIDLAPGEDFFGQDTFQVSFFLRYKDHAAYASSSQNEMDTICHSQSTSTPGLLPAMRTTTTLGSGDDRCILNDPYEENETVIPMDDAGEELAHLITFAVQIEG